MEKAKGKSDKVKSHQDCPQASGWNTKGVSEDKLLLPGLLFDTTVVAQRVYNEIRNSNGGECKELPSYATGYYPGGVGVLEERDYYNDKETKSWEGDICEDCREAKEACRGRRRMSKFCRDFKEYCDAVGCSWDEL